MIYNQHYMSPENKSNQLVVYPLTPEDLIQKPTELKKEYPLLPEEIQNINEQLRVSFNGTTGEIHMATTYAKIVGTYGPNWRVETPDQNKLDEGVFFLTRRQT